MKNQKKWWARTTLEVLAISLALLAVFPAGAIQAAEPPAPPFNLPAGQWRPLGQVQDRDLQARLERMLQQNGLWRTLIAHRDLGVALVDLADARAPRFAQVNGDVMMRAASLPKLAILLAAYHDFTYGGLKETPEIRFELINMIKWSSNAAASRMTDRIGLVKIDNLLSSAPYRFYDPHNGGGIWLGGAYPPTQEHLDPLKGILHGASATQVCRFYYLLAYGRLINPEASRQMLKILAYPLLDDNFVKALGKSIPPSRLYRKSGSYSIFHSDSVLVWGEGGRRYILVGVVQDARGEQVLQDLLPKVERLLAASHRP